MFDSKLLYVVQALLIGGVLYAIVWRQHRILRLQVIAWTIGVSAIAWRYSTEGQLGFYSNDQLQYAAIVRILMNWQWYEGESATLFWWTEYSKIPYPGAAVPLALAGVHVALALKTVSLVCLLALSRELLQRYDATRFTDQIKILYLTGCGLIGTFFSLVALRETMMMYFTYRYVTDRSLIGRLLAIVAVFLLRSHLAAALVVAEIVLAVWKWITRDRRLGFAEAPALIIIGVTLGYMMFSCAFCWRPRVTTWHANPHPILPVCSFSLLTRRSCDSRLPIYCWFASCSVTRSSSRWDFRSSALSLAIACESGTCLRCLRSLSTSASSPTPTSTPSARTSPLCPSWAWCSLTFSMNVAVRRNSVAA